MVDKRKAVANTLSQMDIPGKTDRPKKMIDDATKTKPDPQRSGDGTRNVDMSKYSKVGASNPPNGPKKKY